MNNNSDRHINEEKLKLNRAKYIRDRLEDQYEITPRNSILISLIEYNKVIVEITKYLSHISHATLGSKSLKLFINFSP